MRYIYLLIILCCFSCNNERVLQLPEVRNVEISEVLDVSPAYVFYDETQPDSTLLNRKNLIISTNWLVNVDKRLTLRQAIPHIKFLQDKKRNAEMHKNEDAKNYFTCNDTSISNLGFVEFTDVYYLNESSTSYYKKISKLKLNKELIAEVKNLNEISLFSSLENPRIIKTNYNTLVNDIHKFAEAENITKINLVLNFEESLSFQDYISIKSELLKIESDKIIIDTNEFIY